MVSNQTLSDSDRRVLARWALSCAERVLPLFDADDVARDEILDAVARTRAFSAGDSSAGQEIRKRLVALKAARAATTSAGVAAARAVGQAAAVAHMAAHALGAAAYAAKAVSLAHPEQPELVQEEVRWQVADLSEREREALRLLPPLGADPSGPLAPGLLSRGVLGSTIRQIQAQLGESGCRDGRR
ncbi:MULTISPECIES: putative immunity protein [unclassified Microbacterium]|uniref:putative immunity protein n=1 Tax=Microbacterium TaxID=33882 RepID=UPI003BA25731